MVDFLLNPITVLFVLGAALLYLRFGLSELDPGHKLNRYLDGPDFARDRDRGWGGIGGLESADLDRDYVRLVPGGYHGAPAAVSHDASVDQRGA